MFDKFQDDEMRYFKRKVLFQETIQNLSDPKNCMLDRNPYTWVSCNESHANCEPF